MLDPVNGLVDTGEGEGLSGERLVLGIVDDKSDGSGEGLAVTIVEVGPDTFDVLEIDVLDDVWLALGPVAGGEVVEGSALPEGEHPVSHIDVVVGLVHGEPGDEVPFGVLAVGHPGRVVGQVARPEAIAILL